MAEKSEKATPKKLEDARKKGQVAKSQDFPSAFTFMVSAATLISTSHLIFEQFNEITRAVLLSITQDDLLGMCKLYFMQSLTVIMTASMPILMLTSFAGVIVTFLIQGPVFSVEVFKPDIKKFDPIQNLKAKFKLKTFVELLKSIFKILGAAVIIYFIWVRLIPEILASSEHGPMVWLMLIAIFLKEVIIQVGIFFIIVAVLDLAYQKKDFAKEMMMEKFEIKQEVKNSEGDPQVKGKRKEIAREIAYQGGPAGLMSEAKIVITNPAHLAIAIGYEMNVDPAPIILSMGQHYVARLICKEAEIYKVPIMRNIALAHQLFEEGKILEFIPESTYEVVAEILKWLASLEDYERENL